MIEPYQWSIEEVQAVKSVYDTPDGRFVLDVILHRLGMLHGQSFSTDPHMTAFQEGRRYVAGNLNNVIETPITEFAERKDTHEPRGRIIQSATKRAGASVRRKSAIASA
jgi:hypothetical protein